MEQLHFLHLPSWPIFRQLQLEEALFRADSRNWCIINQGSCPGIVMGISSQVEKLVHIDRWKQKPIPIVRRYSGGGTVVVDEKTLFVSFILNKKHLEAPAFPANIMKWSEELYQPIFDHSSFALRENDYVIGNQKFGGNAQSIAKERFVHHSTLLWDYNSELMNLLTLPEKRPQYRKDREHGDFLCSLDSIFPNHETFWERLEKRLDEKFFVKKVHLEEVEEVLTKPHRKTTCFIH